jgi:anti-sigma factor RsiW
MKCQEIEALLADYLGGELDETKRRALTEHLASCPTCRGEIEALEETVKRLSRFDTVSPSVAAARTSGLTVIRTRSPVLRFSLAAFRAAALLALGAFLGWYAAPRAIPSRPGTVVQPVTTTRTLAPGHVNPKWIELGRETKTGHSSFARNLALLARSQAG